MKKRVKPRKIKHYFSETLLLISYVLKQNRKLKNKWKQQVQVSQMKCHFCKTKKKIIIISEQTPMITIIMKRKFKH